ncbi:glycosyltransferase family 2 protein [Cellulomonas taurus]|uniref:glycosyltransferase family 2 protein n=1 Tax=Cellulomonas taurus TaxID=2729175 RepID=UPI00145F8FC3|nr:glycosyltransferase [Cellulomonas taurus]
MPEQTPSTASAPTVTSVVTAVVVTRGRSPFLPATLRALATQDRAPDRVVLVDVGPGLDPRVAETMDAAGVAGTLLHDPRASTLGAAVTTAAGSATDGWLWLLHDDSAPDPAALAELVRAVEAAPSVAIAGTKQRTWTRPVRLLEVGLRTSRAGHRARDVEPGEVDQGQHDGRDDVLAVGTAGMLVRRDLWIELGGPDPVLGPFGDGLDLCRRARLAGHRVVVVPTAVVRHAQASLHGLRGPDTGPEAFVDLDADGEPDGADPRRSYRARRVALLHQRLVAVPAIAVPFVALIACLTALLRVLIRIASKEPGLAWAELAATAGALGRPGAVLRARRRAARTRRLPRRALRPLQADPRTIWRQWRDRRLTRAEARRVRRAPSELELRELAALARRRRVTLGVLAVVLLVVTAAALGRPLVAALGGAGLDAGDLMPSGSGLGDLWQTISSGWVPGELGARGPADALLTALLPFTLLAGGSVDLALSVLLLGSVLLAGLGAWFAAGAATRSVAVRLWAAVTWAVLPSLLLATGDGRIGAVLVHLALPWFLLGLARAVGAQQVDRVRSGLETASREPVVGRAELSPEEWGDPEAWARAGFREMRRGGRRRRRRGTAVATETETETETETAVETESVDPDDASVDHDADAPTVPRSAVDEADTATPVRGVATVPAADPAPVTTSISLPDLDHPGDPDTTGDALAPDDPTPTGSIAAAAGASLALALIAAGAPVLLVPGLVLLIAAACCAPRGRRRRLLVAGLPALVLLGPTLAEAVSRGADGWRLLVADPGVPQASAPAQALQQVLGVPADSSALLPGWLADLLGSELAAWWPALAGAAVLVPALIALGRGRDVARGVRLGWLMAALGLAAAVLAQRVVVGQEAGAAVVGWAGSGLSFAYAGLLAAAVLGSRGVQTALAEVNFGWRQVTAGLVTLLAVLLPIAGATSWAWQSRQTPTLRTVDDSVVPAIGRQTQQGPDAPRVLALTPQDGGVTGWQLLRGDGPRLVEESAVVRTRTLTGALARPHSTATDPASAELVDLVARLSVSLGEDVSAELAALAVADVLVPTIDEDDTTALGQQRTALVGRLDATPGLERITEVPAGVIWRVQPSTVDGQVAPVVTAWARLVPDASGAATATGLSSADAVAVPAADLTVDTTIAAGAEGRLLVLAERADSGWRATLDGEPLRSVTQGWRQTFEVGATGGDLVVRYQPADRTPWLLAQGLVGALALLLAVPVRRRRAGRR